MPSRLWTPAPGDATHAHIDDEDGVLAAMICFHGMYMCNVPGKTSPAICWLIGTCLSSWRAISIPRLSVSLSRSSDKNLHMYI
jgi:hypothetical protein